MRIIKADARYINTEGMTPYQVMEAAGRTCYKSEKAITEDSAAKFVKKLTENKHTAMLEHAHIYIFLQAAEAEGLMKEPVTNLKTAEGIPDLVTPFLNITRTNKQYEDMAGYKYSDRMYVVSGSFRTFLSMFGTNGEFRDYCPTIESALHKKYPEVFTEEDGWVTNMGDEILDKNEFVKFMNERFPKEERDAIFRKHLTYTIVFTCDRGVSHEFVRHRPCSFAQESTRYCNYSKEKFGNEITVIEPCYWSDHNSPQYKLWKSACENAESSYFELLSGGATAQEARSVLPNSLKTELVMTATEDEWQHIVNLRYHGTTGAPHPQMKEVMSLAMPLLTEASDGRIS